MASTRSHSVSQLLAPEGSVLQDGAGTIATGQYMSVTFVTATVLSSITGRVSGSAIGGFTFPAGFTWNVRFTTLTVSSGKIIAYKA